MSRCRVSSYMCTLVCVCMRVCVCALCRCHCVCVFVWMSSVFCSNASASTRVCVAVYVGMCIVYVYTCMCMYVRVCARFCVRNCIIVYVRAYVYLHCALLCVHSLPVIRSRAMIGSSWETSAMFSILRPDTLYCGCHQRRKRTMRNLPRNSPIPLTCRTPPSLFLFL